MVPQVFRAFRANSGPAVLRRSPYVCGCRELRSPSESATWGRSVPLRQAAFTSWQSRDPADSGSLRSATGAHAERETTATT